MVLKPLDYPGLSSLSPDWQEFEQSQPAPVQTRGTIASSAPQNMVSNTPAPTLDASKLSTPSTQPRTYTPDVERWRGDVAREFKARGLSDADVDKALYVIEGESGGNPRAANPASSARGLVQMMDMHGYTEDQRYDPQLAIKWMADQVKNHGWSDWGEGVTYNGEKFGILGLRPYDAFAPAAVARDVSSSASAQAPGKIASSLPDFTKVLKTPEPQSGFEAKFKSGIGAIKSGVDAVARAAELNLPSSSDLTRAAVNATPLGTIRALNADIPGANTVKNALGDVAAKAAETRVTDAVPVLGQAINAASLIPGVSREEAARWLAESQVPTKVWEAVLMAAPELAKSPQAMEAAKQLLQNVQSEDEGIKLVPAILKAAGIEAKARIASSSAADSLLGASNFLRNARANAGAARSAGYNGTQIARDVLTFGTEAGLTGPAGFGDNDLAAMLEASLKARQGLKAGEKSAEEVQNAAEISQQLNKEAAGASAAYKETEAAVKRAAKLSGLSPEELRATAKRKTAKTVGDLIERERKGTQFSANLGIPTPASPEATAARNTMSNLDAVLKAEDAANGVQKPGGFAESVVNNLRDAAGAPMSLKTTISPALMRQGYIRLITSPKAALEETALSMKAALNEADARAMQKALLEQPWAAPGEGPLKGLTAADVGLKVRDWGADVPAEAKAPEMQGLGESAVGKAIQWLPHVKFSDRQYALEFNAHAINRYAEVAQAMLDAGETNPQAYRDWARVLEHQMQYGSWQQGKIPFFFSTRSISGRVQTLTDLLRNPAGVLKPGATREAYKGAVAMVGGNLAAMYAVAEALPGFSVDEKSFPPKLKTPVGTIDPWAGWASIAKLVYDSGKLIQHDLKEGSVDDIGPDITERLTQFIRGQQSPTAGKLTDIATGKDFKGNEYKLSDLKGDALSGQLAWDMAAPMIADSIIEGYKGYGVAGAVAGGALEGAGGSINQNISLTMLRDKAAQGLFKQPYDTLLPSQQKQVNETPDVAAALAERPKSDYQKVKEATFTPFQEQQDRAEQAFQDGTLSKPITDQWKELSLKREGARAALAEAFKKQLSKFDRDKFDKALDGYYGIEVTLPGVGDGGLDFDATEKAREDYLNQLPDAERTWLNDYLDTAKTNQSPLRQQYLQYIADKDAKGYFKPDITAAERAKLDRANPDLDVQKWYFGGGLKDGKGTPSLQSKAAVDQALAMNLPNRPVKLAGIDRAINESEQTKAAWAKVGARIDKFLSGAQVEKNKEQVARSRYQKNYDELTDSQKSSVASYIQTQVRKSSADLDAWLAWFGKYSTIESFKAGAALRQIRTTYGREPERDDGPIRYANSAR